MTSTATAGGVDVDDRAYDPRVLEEWIGQKSLIRQLIPELRASIIENRAIVAMVWHGGPGLGKSTLAELLAQVRGVNFVLLQGSKITERDLGIFFRLVQDPNVHESQLSDLAGYELRFNAERRHREWVTTGARRRPVLLCLNEWEGSGKRINQDMQDVVAPDARGNRYFQARYDGRSVDVFCPDLTPIIITNHMDQMLRVAGPLVSRCSLNYRFVPYEQGELVTILKQFATKVRIGLDPDAAEALAAKSRGTPRQALHLFRLARNILSISLEDGITQDNRVTLDMIKRSFDQAGLDYLGLNEVEREYLLVLFRAEKMTLPIERLCQMLGETNPRSVEQIVEPDLFRMGLIAVAAGRGRQLTAKGRDYCMNLNPNGRPTIEMVVDGRY